MFNLHRELEPIARENRWKERHWKAVVAYWLTVIASERRGIAWLR